MKALTTTEFIDQRLRLYSAHSNIRGIPFIGDGFKQSHRKAVWGMIKRGENADKDTVERIAAASASCFTAETPVKMADGSYKTIGDLVYRFSVGEKMEVMSFDGTNFKPEKIENAFLTKYATELVELEFETGKIRCTPDHQFLTNRGWVEAKDLTLEDNVISF